MDVFFVIFVFFTIFVLCSMCGFCCRKKDEGAIFSTPVVVTSTTHQAPGSNYATPIMTNETTVVTAQMPYPQNMPMPMNYPPNNSPYPMQQQPVAPYPPIGSAAPYPPMNTASAPYPAAAAPQNMYPPSYVEAMGQAPPQSQEGYVKQSPYNPSFGN